MTLIIWSFGFLRMGTVGIVSQLYAKSDYREISRTIIRNFLFVVLISLTIILFLPIIIDLTKKIFFLLLMKQRINKHVYFCKSVFCTCRTYNLYFNWFLFRYTKNKISSLFIIILSSLNIVLSSFFVLSFKFKYIWSCFWNINCKLYYSYFVSFFHL